MLSEYYILQLHFLNLKENDCNNLQSHISTHLPLPPHQNIVPLQSNFQQEPGITPYREQNFQQIYVINM